MKEVCICGHNVLVPFLNSAEMKTFPEISKDDIDRLNDAVKKFTAAKTYAKSQKILSDYVASIDAKNPANTFYKSMLGMMLNSRQEVYKSL
ncbi:MAG: hypothetical protein WA139_04585 [Candidatus Aenigmatarchaeota archaeon]